MRQRRSWSSSTTTRIIHHDQRRPSSPAAIPIRVSRNSLTSSVILVISGTVGFVISACTLLLILSPYLERDTPFYGTSNYLIPQQDVSLPHWEWHEYYGTRRNQTRYQGNTTVTPKQLIVQVSTSPSPKNLVTRDHLTPSNDLDLLDITSRVNRAYAKKWRIDYAKVDFPQIDPIGDELHSPLKDVIQGNFSIENFIGGRRYIGLLRDILNIGRNGTSPEINVATDPAISNNSGSHVEHPYEFVWIFCDPSMMAVDFENRIFEHNDILLTSLTENLAAVSDNSFDVRSHSSLMTDALHSIINEGALLWNLNHQYISHLLDSWEELNQLRDALYSIERLTQQGPLWKQIPDDKSVLYHIPFESKKTLSTSAMSNESSKNHDSERQEVLNHFNNTHDKNLASSWKEDSVLPSPHQMRAIKLQSVADLVCFRYFPCCDLL